MRVEIQLNPVELPIFFFVLFCCCLFVFSIESFYMITVWSYWSSPNKTNKTVGILVTQLYFRGNNGKRSCLQATMLVFQTNPVEAELFSYVTFSIVTFSYEGRFRSSYWTKKKKGGGEGNLSPPPLPSPPPPPLFHSCATFSTISLGNSCYAGDFSLFQYITTATVSISSYNEL